MSDKSPRQHMAKKQGKTIQREARRQEGQGQRRRLHRSSVPSCEALGAITRDADGSAIGVGSWLSWRGRPAASMPPSVMGILIVAATPANARLYSLCR
jgi:hypothetical protein